MKTRSRLFLVGAREGHLAKRGVMERMKPIVGFNAKIIKREQDRNGEIPFPIIILGRERSVGE